MCGVFAVGVSAFSFEEFVKIKNPATFGAAEISAPVATQGDGDFEKDFAAFLYDAELYAGATLESSPAAMAYSSFAHNKNSFKSSKAQREFHKALEAALKASAEHNARDAFMSDDAAIKAAYADGTLKNKLVELYVACAKKEIAIYEKLVPEYFIPDAMAFGEEYRKILELYFTFLLAGLPKETHDEVNAKIGIILTNELGDKLNKAIDNSDVKEAAKIVKNARKELEKILAEYGIVEISPEPPDPSDPSFITKVLRFIVKWFFFGWLWMKK